MPATNDRQVIGAGNGFSATKYFSRTVGAVTIRASLDPDERVVRCFKEKVSVPKQVFISLPVRDLKKAITFYTAIGATQNLQFSDDTAACMVMSEAFFVMLLTHAKWATFTNKPIVEAHRESEVMIGLSADDKSAVDRITSAAATQGGKADVNPKQDLGFMYARSFEDLDGHLWECTFMDMSQVPKG